MRKVYCDVPDWSFKNTINAQYLQSSFDMRAAAVCVRARALGVNFNQYFKRAFSVYQREFHMRIEHGALIYASTMFAKYKRYVTNRANVDNHRTWQLPPRRSQWLRLILASVTATMLSSCDTQRDGENAICIIRTSYSRDNKGSINPLRTVQGRIMQILFQIRYFFLQCYTTVSQFF